MSVVRLLVLGIARMRGPVHGYAVHRELVEWRVDTWTRVKPGSIYHALKQLTKEGHLREEGIEESTEGPGRTLYALTSEGEREFYVLLGAALSSFDIEHLGAGIAFMQTLPRARVLELLRALHERTTETVENLERLIPNFPHREEPPHTEDLLTLWSGSVSATAAWTAQLIRRLERGEYRMAGEGEVS
jgi:DNA-binding PadR family transcriptional regulator